MDPGSTRPPVPFALIALLASKMMQQQANEAALAILLTFSAYLRPGEALGIQAQDVVLPSKAVKFYAINLHPMDRLETSKTGLSDESILLDSPTMPHLGNMIGKLKKARKSGPLFRINYAQLKNHWHKTLQQVGLRRDWAVLYQLRHSGPSHDRLHRLRTTLEVKLRGRWEADSSVKRYEAHSKLALEFQNLPPEVQRQALQAEQSLGSLMARSQFPKV